MHKYYPNGVTRNITEFFYNDDVMNIGRRIISCCNYTGVANIDMRIDNRDKSIKVLECNPRFWTTVNVSMLAGVNFPYLGILTMRDNANIMDVDCRDIRYVTPGTLVSGLIRNLSLNDVNLSVQQHLGVKF